MTLTLDDIRSKRFRMARKSGYEVLEVDEFVDEVEESFAQLMEENQNLKKQVEALKAAPPPPPQPIAPAAPTVQAPPPRQPPPPPQPQSGTIVVTTGKEASAAEDGESGHLAVNVKRQRQFQRMPELRLRARE